MLVWGSIVVNVVVLSVVVKLNVNTEMCLLLTRFDWLAFTVDCGVQNCVPALGLSDVTQAQQKPKSLR